MRSFAPGQPPNVVHHSLKSASLTMEKAKQNAVLWFGEVVQRKLFRDAGYSSIHHYAQAELDWSRSKTYEFLSICQKLEKLPRVKAKVATGELGFAHTREIVKVTDADNQEDWLDVAMRSSSRKLATEVKQAKRKAASVAKGQTSLLPNEPDLPPAIVPTRISMEMSSTQVARYEALWEKARKVGGLSSDKVEALLDLMAFYVEEKSTRVDSASRPKTSPPAHSPAHSPVQIHVHQCPACQKTTTSTHRGELILNRPEQEKIRCDAQISRPGKRNTSAIPPRTRREVLSRDRFRCQRPGCAATSFLEVHHRVPRSQGGSNTADNLVTLCCGCHQLVHEKGLRVKAPEVVYLGSGTNYYPVHRSSPA